MSDYKLIGADVSDEDVYEVFQEMMNLLGIDYEVKPSGIEWTQDLKDKLSFYALGSRKSIALFSHIQNMN
ncbi:hypothetical protein VPIG_00117 [Vibrio phage PWH3a-P1]|uniref:hypothetical protein n=1 Tax=Vibrio phage PWH3a-P1 TaxID=754058 RepID=UPI0002C064C9|nr:hypothetical protein VPIG_00117 [Vibrio phage PWH3a-P1]AGH31974.1 hypothetical protein VPIG_00117 [Vibrio phage PWH3a-P1]